MSDANNISMLMEMGFDAAKAKEALGVCDGNVERAIEFLISGGRADAPSSSSISSTLSGPHQDIVAALSQYSMDDGRSACTCIALNAAQNFLLNPSPTTLQPEFMEVAIHQGISIYNELQQSVLSVSNGVEHMSAEDVLKAASSAGTNPFANIQLTSGGIRQGILSKSNSADNEMGLYALLTACHRDEPPKDAWLAVLITKTPETVLAILPPRNSPQYIVMDSHPRPGVVPGNGAYIRIMSCLEDLVAHLNVILPATELGPDIPEMMATMYNSFDLYPLIVQKN
jgi:UBA/TS-N domain